MCLRIKNFKTKKEAIKAKKNPLIAKKNITVWKILRKDGKSIFKYFTYEKGFHYYQEGKEFSFGNVEIDTHLINILYTWGFRVEQGLHSWSTRNKALEEKVYSQKIVKMIIPKGAKYYIGSNSDIVSNQLIYP